MASADDSRLRRKVGQVRLRLVEKEIYMQSTTLCQSKIHVDMLIAFRSRLPWAYSKPRDQDADKRLWARSCHLVQEEYQGCRPTPGISPCSSSGNKWIWFLWIVSQIYKIILKESFQPGPNDCPAKRSQRSRPRISSIHWN